MGNKSRPKTNAEMCEIVTLRRKGRAQDERICQLESALKKATWQLHNASRVHGIKSYDHSVKEYEELLEQK